MFEKLLTSSILHRYTIVILVALLVTHRDCSFEDDQDEIVRAIPIVF
jgi:hypothetical protein